MAPASRPVLVLDSASLYYRSFYALPERMTAPDGRPHNAVRGFLSTVTRLTETHAPGGIVACWDNDWRPAWRVDLVPSYKAHRVADDASVEGGGAAEAEPESLGPQAVAIAGLLAALGIPRWGVDGYEADDVIGSVTAQLAPPTIVVTGDRDLVQLIDERTSVLLTVNGGMEKWPLLDPVAAQERFGVSPACYVDLAVLRGDPSDGLPGVPGIGAKTAVALVTAFGSVDGILAAAREPVAARPLTPRLAAALLAHEDSLARTERVARVVRDLPLPSTAVALPREPHSPDALAALAAEWGVQRQVADLQAALRRQGEAAPSDG
jgi:5'-3' exonuclease